MKTITIRLADDVHAELEHLSTILDCSKNSLVEMLIRQEYSKYETDPKLKEALDQIQQIRELISSFKK